MRVLDSEAMRAVDRRAIEEVGIPGLVLMENAAIGVADALGKSFPEAVRVLVVCGLGNNGGDGLALARHLDVRGYRVEVALVHGGKPLSPDAKRHWSISQQIGLPSFEVSRSDDLSAMVASARGADLVVDALFGTGLSRPLQGLFAQAVQGLNACGRPVVAVDLPSGLDASRALPPGPHVQASLTVTFAAPKVAHVFPPARDACGELVVTDLGIPSYLVEEAPGGLRLLLAEEMAATLPLRQVDSHKGDHGHLLLVAGSPGKAGAVVLAARAAVRSGTGLVTAGVPASLLPTVDLGSLESMTLALPATELGGLSLAAVDRVLDAGERKTALAMGPGLGCQGETGEAVRRIALEWPGPLLLDADGVNAFGGRPEALAKRTGTTVLTPHPGELSRLLDRPTAEIAADRIAAARQGAERCQAVVVLKGHQTLVASPDGSVAINTTGNAGMASGGTGDVLTGLVGGFLARFMVPEAAACVGVFLHGLAGDLAVEEKGQEALAAGDVVDYLHRAFGLLVDV